MKLMKKKETLRSMINVYKNLYLLYSNGISKSVADESNVEKEKEKKS